MKARTCIDCAKPISADSTGRCRSCATPIRNRTPAAREAAAKVMRANRAIGLCKGTGGDPAKAQRASFEARMGWCPEEWRPCYYALVGKRSISAAEAKRITLDEMARAERKRLATMTPHERALDRLRNGATLTEKFTPTREHAFSLTGSGMAAL